MAKDNNQRLANSTLRAERGDMAILGIDGNMWYVCKDSLECLGDPRSSFVFSETPRKAFDEWNRKHPQWYDSAEKHSSYIDMTVEQYRRLDDDSQPQRRASQGDS